MLAINSGNIDKIQNLLIKDRKSLNRNIHAYPPIYYAVRAGHYDIVEFFLKSGCSLKFKGDKSTPMHCAAYYGHYTLIPLLLFYGLPTDIKNYSDNLPIDEAAS